ATDEAAHWSVLTRVIGASLHTEFFVELCLFFGRRWNAGEDLTIPGEPANKDNLTALADLTLHAWGRSRRPFCGNGEQRLDKDRECGAGSNRRGLCVNGKARVRIDPECPEPHLAQPAKIDGEPQVASLRGLH